MKIHTTLFFLCGVFLLGAGCAGLVDERRAPPPAAQTEIVLPHPPVDLDNLKARLEGVELAQQDMVAQLAAMREQNEKDKKELQDSETALDSAVKTLQKSRETNKNEIIDQLSARIHDIMQAEAGASKRPAPTGGKSGKAMTNSGAREHVVTAGETLSSIAAAFKVKPEAIAEANHLKSSNIVRIGQTLVIPE